VEKKCAKTPKMDGETSGGRKPKLVIHPTRGRFFIIISIHP
jgi:hypothetical protein